MAGSSSWTPWAEKPANEPFEPAIEITPKPKRTNARPANPRQSSYRIPKITTFHKFQDLPAELRELIWKTALPDSRIIILEHKRRKLDAESAAASCRIDRLGFRSDVSPLAVLFVCHEAHKVASRYYKRAFSNKLASSIPEIWFDFRNDFLYLGPEYLGPHYIGPGPSANCHQERVIFVLENELHVDDLSRIENLAVWWDGSVNGFNGPWTVEKYLADILSHFGNIKHVTIVGKLYVLHGLWPDTTPKKHANLRFLDAEVDSPFMTVADFTADLLQDFQPNITVQGLQIPNSNTWLSLTKVDMKKLAALSSLSGGKADSLRAWNVPRIDYDVITTPFGEKLLLQEAGDAPPVPQRTENMFDL